MWDIDLNLSTYALYFSLCWTGTVINAPPIRWSISCAFTDLSYIHSQNKRCHIHLVFRKRPFLSFLTEKARLPLSDGFDLNVANIGSFSDPRKVTYSLVPLNGTLSGEEALVQSHALTLFPWQRGIISFTFLLFSFTFPHLAKGFIAIHQLLSWKHVRLKYPCAQALKLLMHIYCACCGFLYTVSTAGFLFVSHFQTQWLEL